VVLMGTMNVVSHTHTQYVCHAKHMHSTHNTATLVHTITYTQISQALEILLVIQSTLVM